MTSPVPSKVLLFGATGVIGKYILSSLVGAKPAFEKVGIFTSPGTEEKKGHEIKKLKEKGVEIVVGDVNDEGHVKKAFEGKFILISFCSGPWPEHVLSKACLSIESNTPMHRIRYSHLSSRPKCHPCPNSTSRPRRSHPMDSHFLSIRIWNRY